MARNLQACVKKTAVWAHDYQAKEQQFVAEASVVNSLRDNRSVPVLVLFPDTCLPHHVLVVGTVCGTLLAFSTAYLGVLSGAVMATSHSPRLCGISNLDVSFPGFSALPHLTFSVCNCYMDTSQARLHTFLKTGDS
jgi:hypothetical protein